MKNLRLVLRGEDILKKSGAKNAHRLGMRTAISAPTISRYIGNSGEIKAMDMGILANLLTRALGISEEELLNLRLGDVFEVVEDLEEK